MANNPVAFFEIGCKDGGAASEFFSELFGWQIGAPSPAREIATGGAADLPGHLMELAEEWGTYVTVYVQVDHLETYLAKVEALGGRTLVPPVELPGGGRFAWFAAPEGNVLGLWQQ
ncbi:MAG: VOC family protein [Pseudomonadota bacterium]